jgi:4-hydroxy-2-oxoglutarate aldolase
VTAKVLEGVLVPITTPFDQSGEVATDRMRDNARRLLDAGVNGIVVAGSTGEAPLLERSEMARLIGCLRNVIPDDRWLLAGTGAESTRETVQATRAAADAGADLVLVRPPAYYGPALSPQALEAHFRAVADASPVPILIYNIPVYTHIRLPEALLASLTDHERIVGAKDSSGDLKTLAAYREAARTWRLFVGSGAVFCAGLELGCEGGLLAVACFAPRESVDVYRTFRAGRRAEAAAIQERLTQLHREIVTARGVAGVKAAMDAVGLYGGRVRAPLLDLPAEEQAKVKQLTSPQFSDVRA